MHVLLTCKNEVDPIKNEGTRVFTRFIPLSHVKDVLVTSQYKEDPIKNRGARVFTTLYCLHQCFRRARADNSGVGSGIWPQFELIQAFMRVLATCKNEDDQFVHKIYPIISLWGFFQTLKGS